MYYESAEGVKITAKRVYKELKDHGVAVPDDAECRRFHDEVKPDSNGLYDAQQVLNWLGY